MKKIYLSICLLICGLGLAHAQTPHFESATLIQTYSRSDLDAYLTAQGIPAGVVEIRNALKVYKVVYSTVSYDSTATIASGTLFLPDSAGDCRRPILNYNHGTIIKKIDAPSNMVGEYLVGVAFSANGYIVVMPDYLGLGDSPGLHPYHHAHSEATCVVDMLRASKEYMDSVSYPYNDQLFITGYSQGGHVAMATHRMIQQDLSAEFTVTASAPLSGAYDVSGVQAEVITKDSIYDAPGYLPFIIFSYNMVYNLYPSWDDVLTPPYNTTIPPLMDGSVGLGTVEGFMPDTPNLILIPELLDTFETDMTHPIRLALKDNDVYQWAPQCPTRLGYCTADKLVSYRNAIVAADTMTARGAPDVQAILVNEVLGHQDCALFALMGVKGFFEPFREDLIEVSLTTTDVSSASSTDGDVTTSIDGGVSSYGYAWNTGDTTASLSNIGAGTYTVTVTDSRGCTATASTNIGVVGIDEQGALASVYIYPNPATSVFNISLSASNTQDYFVNVLDLMGKSVYTTTIPQGRTLVSIDAGTWGKGIYIVRVHSAGKAVMHKLVIN